MTASVHPNIPSQHVGDTPGFGSPTSETVNNIFQATGTWCATQQDQVTLNTTHTHAPHRRQDEHTHAHAHSNKLRTHDTAHMAHDASITLQHRRQHHTQKKPRTQHTQNTMDRTHERHNRPKTQKHGHAHAHTHAPHTHAHTYSHTPTIRDTAHIAHEGLMNPQNRTWFKTHHTQRTHHTKDTTDPTHATHN